MRIVLCVTPEFHSETPPLGLAYLKSSLVKEGHSVRCLDLSKGHKCVVSSPLCNLDMNIKDYIEQHYETIVSWTKDISYYKPDVIGITLWTSTKTAACALALVLKEKIPTAVIVGGGPDCLHYNIKEYLNYFDYLIEKEGEQVICKFLEEYQTKGKINNTKGIWYKDAGEVCFSGIAERIRDLDMLCSPDFSDFGIEAYSAGIPVMFSRGCNYDCVFCTGKTYFNNQISRRGLYVYQEILAHINTRGTSKFIFVDDSLLSTKTLNEFKIFCDNVIKNKLEIGWRIYGQRVTPLLYDDFVAKMVEAGLKEITFGVESFSDKIRKDMGKFASNGVTEKTISYFTDKGVKVSLLMIYGYPIESDEDFEKTLFWIKEKGGRFANICFNCFIVNSEYRNRRPGIVKFEKESWHPYKWSSDVVNLEKRKQRFLRLIEVLNGLGTEYMISEPCLSRYLRSWGRNIKDDLERQWSIC